MPTFDFQSPDGRKYSITGPEGATPEQAFAVLQQHLAHNQNDSWWKSDPMARDRSASSPSEGGAVPFESDGPAKRRAAPVGEPGMPEGVVRAGATGVPIIGGLANKHDAATNAAVAPIVDRFLPDNEQLGFQLVAHHVAAAAGGGELLAEFVERGPVIIYNGDDVALRTAPPWQLPKQHNRLTVADQ
jgi:hypothetical protein